MVLCFRLRAKERREQLCGLRHCNACDEMDVQKPVGIHKEGLGREDGEGSNRTTIRLIFVESVQPSPLFLSFLLAPHPGFTLSFHCDCSLPCRDEDGQQQTRRRECSTQLRRLGLLRSGTDMIQTVKQKQIQVFSLKVCVPSVKALQYSEPI
jgi:hypothetical protein